LFPFSSCPVLLSCPGASRLRSTLVCYARSMLRGPATHGGPPPSCSYTGDQAQETGHERRQDNRLAVHNPISPTRGEGRNMATPSRILCKEEALQSGGIWGDTTGIDSSLRTFYPFFKKEDVMPVSKNKPTTLSPEGSTSESASNPIRLAGRNFASIYGVWP